MLRISFIILEIFFAPFFFMALASWCFFDSKIHFIFRAVIYCYDGIRVIDAIEQRSKALPSDIVIGQRVSDLSHVVQRDRLFILLQNGKLPVWDLVSGDVQRLSKLGFEIPMF